MIRSILVVIFIVIAFGAFAQEPTTIVRDTVVEESYVPDTVLIESYAKRYSPRKALLFAAVFPGLGQAYNKKYWKIPLVYGGLGYTGYWMSRYQSTYQRFKVQLFYNIENNLGESGRNPESGRTTSNLRTIVDQARRERDFMIIVMGGIYLLQIVDAHVDAHLKEFDLNPNLQVSIEPMMENSPMIGRQTGVSLIFRF